MTKLARLRNKADKLFQIHNKKFNCEICGKPANCVHHLIAKSLSSYLRYDEKNGLSVCSACHLFIHSTADINLQHKITEIVGKKRMKYLEENRRKTVKISQRYYLEVIKKYE